MFTVYQAYARTPSVAPSVTGSMSASGFKIGYRLLTASGVSGVSPLSTNAYALPLTVACPLYQDSPDDLRYEVVYLSGGTYFSLGVSYNPEQTFTSLPAVPSAIVPTENFASGIVNPSLGLFSNGITPSVTFYARWNGLNIRQFSFNILKEGGQKATELQGQVLLSFDGTVDVDGSVDASFAAGRIWDDFIVADNAIYAELANGQYAKMTLMLTNYNPVAFGVMQSGNFVLDLQAGTRTYPAPYYQGPSPSMVFQPTGFPWPSITDNLNGTADVVFPMFYAYGRFIGISSLYGEDISAGQDRVVVGFDGSAKFVVSSAYTLDPLKEFYYADVTSLAAPVPLVNFSPPNTASGYATTALLMGQVLYWDNNGLNATAGTLAGICLKDTPAGGVAHYGIAGIMFVRTSAASLVNVGGAISGSYGPYRLYQVNGLTPVTVGGSANLSVAANTSTSLTIGIDTGTDVTLNEATGAEAGLLTAYKSVRLEALDDLGILPAPIRANATLEEALVDLANNTGGSGGSGGLTSRQTAAVSTGSIAPGANFTGTVPLAKAADIVMIRSTSSVPCRVRLYDSVASQTTDLGRSVGVAPAAGVGVAEVILNATVGYAVKVTPVNGFRLINTDTVITAAAPITVLNSSLSAADPSIEIVFIPQEA